MTPAGVISTSLSGILLSGWQRFICCTHSLCTFSVATLKHFILTKANQYIQYFHRLCCSTLLFFSAALAVVGRPSGYRSWQKFGLKCWFCRMQTTYHCRQTFHILIQKVALISPEKICQSQKTPKEETAYSSRLSHRVNYINVNYKQLNTWLGEADTFIPFHHTVWLHCVSNHHYTSYFFDIRYTNLPKNHEAQRGYKAFAFVIIT